MIGNDMGRKGIEGKKADERDQRGSAEQHHGCETLLLDRAIDRLEDFVLLHHFDHPLAEKEPAKHKCQPAPKDSPEPHCEAPDQHSPPKPQHSAKGCASTDGQ